MQVAKENKQVLRTREWIFEALIILLDAMAYEDIKITHITDKAGVARQTFYRNYESKDDIIIKYLDDMFRELQAKVQKKHNKSQKAVYILLFQLFLEHKEALIKIKNAGLDYLLFNQLWSYNQFFFKNAFKKETSTNSELFNEFLIKYQMGGTTSIMIEWIKMDMSLSPEKIGEIVYEIAKRFSDQEAYIPDILNTLDYTHNE
ncbi:TetR/AcrR family transcriptional regulator [Paenibacillus sp. CGMCC 1.18879]|uniref:TetR/AcrR family transcriptional regulator n=1 Tax=Paenibacillus sp. CGMCC 1.18879 TaxID=2834466 RepID=UPI001CA8C586|nr:TetR/AcrR family transcriptional regulator [Paenibacillus sp. CGMCC 1.18879]MBY9079515.1 TetR/AcrR family transcriptional regulator [Paenibacillus sp. CGMCC 1.18879]